LVSKSARLIKESISAVRPFVTFPIIFVPIIYGTAGIGSEFCYCSSIQRTKWKYLSAEELRLVDTECFSCCFVKGSHRIVLSIHGSDFPGSEIDCFEPGNGFQDCLFQRQGFGCENLSALTLRADRQDLLARCDVVADREILKHLSAGLKR
jgi:hypothetical protein